jgi:hypothetical protein
MNTRRLKALLKSVGFPCLVAALVATSARADITSNLQVRYRFDEATGTRVADSSGNDRTGTVANDGLVTSVGRFGGGVHLDGTNDYIDFTAISATDNAQALTIAFWLNTDSRSQFEQIVTKYQDPNNMFAVIFGDTIRHRHR